MRPAQVPPKLKLGISSCLLGHEVRYDGGHKRDPFLTDVLGEYVDWVPVCPEVEIGLGTPRPPIRLQTDATNRVRLVIPSTGEDLTKTMHDYATDRMAQLDMHDLSGYVLKSRSPSCGMRRVKVRAPGDGKAARPSPGAFADVVLRERPHLPAEEEGRLFDLRLRENFISRIFAFRRWKDLVGAGLTRQSLAGFHAVHESQLMSHNQTGTRRLARLLGSASSRRSPERLAAEYLDGFTEVMRRVPTRRSHVKVLNQVTGRVSKYLDESDRTELADAIAEYRNDTVPVIVPINLLRQVDVPEFREQTYLWPHPHGLGLLSHV